MNSVQPLNWQPLELLGDRFNANVAALAQQNPELAGRLQSLVPAEPFFIAAQGNTVFLGRSGPAGIEAIHNPLPAQVARQTVSQIFPKDRVTGAIVVGGLAYGWLWDRLAKLPCGSIDGAPGHRPPIYFLTADIERLWAVLHMMDWREMLADPRFPIFCGPDACEQLRDALVANPMLPRPALSVGTESALWSRGDFNALIGSVRAGSQDQLDRVQAGLRAIYATSSAGSFAKKFESQRLRVLGITSRYTTFIQHSMRDWLAGFEELGHETRLLIEPADHLSPAPLGFAQAALDYKPDLIVIIDHYRAELGTLPAEVPCVMWVQDHLPNIYNAAAGAAQGSRDFSIGFGRLRLTQSFGYPAERFMACPIGINEERFKPPVLSPEDRNRYGCDVSYISHASTPADVLLKKALAGTSDPSVVKLLWDLYDRLVGDFQQGGVTHAEWQIKLKLDESIAQTGIEPPPERVRSILWLFNMQINNALFRHQALAWAAQLGVHLKLYGNGWEQHPTLARFACGPADTVRDVPKICAASRINLQITPHGSVHQRLLEGLVAGGFYLLRWTPGDELGIAFRSLRNWCIERGIRNESALRSTDDPQARRWIAQCDELRVDHADGTEFRLYGRLMDGGEAELMIRAGGVWPEEYPQVSFRSADELQAKLARFLGDERGRQQVAAAMRSAIVQNYTYARISHRLLEFIAADLKAQCRPQVFAAA